MTKEQQMYVVAQVRGHAKWLLDNALLTHPVEPTESDVAYAADRAGFILRERPIYQITLPPTEVHEANAALVQAYTLALNALVDQYVTDTLASNADNPATILNRFISEASQIQIGV